jgi:transposase
VGVVIGVDPHRATHTAVAIGPDEKELGRVQVRATGSQVDQLPSWAASFETRT